MSAPSALPVPPVPPAAPPPAVPDAPVPRRAQAVALLVLLAVTGLIGWRWYSDRYRARPTELQRDVAHRIDLNRATRSELMQIPGVGPQLAERIVSHRDSRGQFARVEDLDAVHGIGGATLNKIRPWVVVNQTDLDSPPQTPARTPANGAGPAHPQAADNARREEARRARGSGQREHRHARIVGHVARDRAGPRAAHRRRAREAAVRHCGRVATRQRDRPQKARRDPLTRHGRRVISGPGRYRGRQSPRKRSATNKTVAPPVNRPHSQNAWNCADERPCPVDPAYHSSGPTGDAIGGRPA